MYVSPGSVMVMGCKRKFESTNEPYCFIAQRFL